jgi:hypothetical protein
MILITLVSLCLGACGPPPGGGSPQGNQTSSSGQTPSSNWWAPPQYQGDSQGQAGPPPLITEDQRQRMEQAFQDAKAQLSQIDPAAIAARVAELSRQLYDDLTKPVVSPVRIDYPDDLPGMNVPGDPPPNAADGQVPPGPAPAAPNPNCDRSRGLVLNDSCTLSDLVVWWEGVPNFDQTTTVSYAGTNLVSDLGGGEIPPGAYTFLDEEYVQAGRPGQVIAFITCATLSPEDGRRVILLAVAEGTGETGPFERPSLLLAHSFRYQSSGLADHGEPARVTADSQGWQEGRLYPYQGTMVLETASARYRYNLVAGFMHSFPVDSNRRVSSGDVRMKIDEYLLLLPPYMRRG